MTSVISPSDFGFPPKFSQYRRNQFELAAEVAFDTHRFQGVHAPTGTGKSLMYLTAVRLLASASSLPVRALVLVGTKGLQDQLLHDFNALGMVDMRGQSNYPCTALYVTGEYRGYARPGTSCADAPCHAGLPCAKREGGCLYYDQQRLAQRATIVVDNYSHWISIGRYSDPEALGKFDILICDEAHTAPRWVAKHCTVELDRNTVLHYLGAKLPPINEGLAAWSSWARTASITATERHAEVVEELQITAGDDRRDLLRQALVYKRLINDLDAVANAHDWHSSEGSRLNVKMPGLQIDWVFQSTERGVRFEPTWAHPYTEELLFRNIKRVVFASATLTPEIAKYLGIDARDMRWHEVSQGFSPRRRPFYFIPTVRVDRRMVEGQVRLWVNRIDAIIEGRLDRKGIIHTVSYARALELLARSRFAHLMITHERDNMRATVDAFKRADAPTILVSPSVVEGFDFPYDEARYQIIAKIPFTDGRDPVEKARRKADGEWPNYVAAQALIQMAGRSMRAADDVSETFIVDDHWRWFQYAVKFPKWFKESWRWVDRVPPAIDLEMPMGIMVGPGKYARRIASPSPVG